MGPEPPQSGVPYDSGLHHPGHTRLLASYSSQSNFKNQNDSYRFLSCGEPEGTWGVYVNKIYSGLSEGTKICLRVQNLGLYLISDNTARVKIQINYLPRPCKKEQRKQQKQRHHPFNFADGWSSRHWP